MYEIKVVYASVGLTVESQYFKKSVNSYSPDVPFAESLRTDSLTFVLSTLADFALDVYKRQIIYYSNINKCDDGK